MILQQETQWEWQFVLFDGSLLLDPVLTGEKERVKKFELADAAARHMMIRIATLMLHEQRELRLQVCQNFSVHHQYRHRHHCGLLGQHCLQLISQVHPQIQVLVNVLYL